VDSAEAIVKWAEKQPSTHRKPTKRLSQAEVGLLLQLHKEGKSQVEIAQLLGVTQGAISRWLQNTTDSTGIAKSYLRGSALRMAQNIVRNGQAKDHVQALKGLGVLEEQQQQGVTVIVGNGGSVNIGVLVSPPDVTVESESVEKH
jgi:hypothetical protein